MLSDSDGERELREYEYPPARSSGSGLALAPPGALSMATAIASAAAPRIDQLNVSKKSRMHIGPTFEFVNVTQNMHNTEVVQGHVLGLELEMSVGKGNGEEEKTNTRRLRCSIAVFICWALMVTAAIASYLLWHNVLEEKPERLDLDITEPWYLRRANWQAMPAYGTLTMLKRPVRYALVGHSATSWCVTRYNCTNEVLRIQSNHMRLGWTDIGPNFLISGNGLVFEGRGASVVGAMVLNWNSISVSLMFLGDYRVGHDTPSAVQLQHAAVLLEVLVRAGVLHPQYTLLGHCQVAPLNYKPGKLLLNKLKTFKHWDNVNTTFCL